MDRQRPKLSRAATQPNNFLDRRLVVSGFAFMVGVSLFLGARNTQNMGVDDNISVSANNYAMPSRALAAHQDPLSARTIAQTIAAKPVAVKAPVVSFSQAVNRALVDNTDQEIGTATYRLGSRVAPTLLGKALPKHYIDCSGWSAANTLATMTAINHKFGDVYDMDKMIAILNSVAADQIRIIANETGHIVGNAKIRAGKDLYPGMLIGVGGMDDGRFKGIGHIGQIVELSGKLFVSDSNRLGAQDGVLLTPFKDWLADTNGHPVYAVDPFVLTTSAGKHYAATRLPAPYHVVQSFHRPVSYAPNVFHTASYQTSFDAHKASVVMVPAAVPPVSVAHVQPAVTAPPPAIVQTVSVQKSVLNKVHPVAMNMGVGMGSSLLVKGGVLVAAHFGLAAMMATGPVLAGALALAVTTAVVKGVAMEAISGSGKPRDNYWYLKAAKEAVSVKKLSILAMSVFAGGVLMGASAEAANHFGITDIVSKHAHQALAAVTGKPTHAALLQHIGTAPTSVTPVHEVVKNIATVPAEFGADQIGNATQIIKQDDVMSSKLFATAHGNAVVLKHAAALLQQGTDLAKAAHLTTTRAAQHMFANLAYAQYNGVGVAKNLAGAANTARMAGNAVHGYGQHLLAMMDNAARPVARVTMSRVLANTLDVG